MRPRVAVLPLLAFALAILLGPTPAVLASPDVAAIEATAPLADASDEAVQAAIVTAVQKAARGALAMGLPWLKVQGAYVRPGYVGVHVIAMRKPADEDSDAAPDDDDGLSIDRPDMSDTKTIDL